MKKTCDGSESKIFDPSWVGSIFVARLGLVMGPGQKFLTRVRSGQFFVGWVVSAIYGLGFENFPTIFYPSGQKKSLWVW